MGKRRDFSLDARLRTSNGVRFGSLQKKKTLQGPRREPEENGEVLGFKAKTPKRRKKRGKGKRKWRTRLRGRTWNLRIITDRSGGKMPSGTSNISKATCRDRYWLNHEGSQGGQEEKRYAPTHRTRE